LKIDVRGDLAGILAISLKTKTPATGTGVSQVEMVAGTRNTRLLNKKILGSLHEQIRTCDPNVIC